MPQKNLVEDSFETYELKLAALLLAEGVSPEKVYNLKVSKRRARTDKERSSLWHKNGVVKSK